MKELFYEAYEYAQKFSSCVKLSVGACFLANDGRKFFSCNNGGEHNCNAIGECYKAKVTGIYESCEETRKYCQAIHAEINMISKLKEEGVNPADGTLFVTRYPCENCARNVAEFGFKTIKYCGRQEVSDTVKGILSGLDVEWFPEIDFENEFDKKWWTYQLYEKAYELVQDHKFPVLIPSYNNSNPVAVRGFLSKMDENFNYPIIIFVRDSQKSAYIEANTHPYVTVVSMPDEMIDSAGKARRWSLKWLYDNGYDHAFSFDDDALDIVYTQKAYTANGEIKNAVVKSDNVARVLAMWQLAMEELERRYDRVVLTAPYGVGFGWKMEYGFCDQSALLFRGNLNQTVCLNVKNLIENGITYYDNRVCGHEDIDLVLQSLQKNMVVATLPFINYAVPPMDVANFSAFGTTMEDRMKAQQAIMKERWKDYEYVTYKDKRGQAQVVPNFRKFRKDFGYQDNVIDLWQHGKLINKEIRL